MSYISKLFSTGAVRETPKQVMHAMLQAIGKGPYGTVIEFGAGKGELTHALLRQHVSFASYHAFEIDPEACLLLQQTFPGIAVHQSSAFEFAKCLSGKEQVSLFVSSIPLSFYSSEKINALLSAMKERLEPGGKIIIIFSAIWLIPVLKKALPGAAVSGFLTFPPYFFLSYQG